MDLPQPRSRSRFRSPTARPRSLSFSLTRNPLTRRPSVGSRPASPTDSSRRVAKLNNYLNRSLSRRNSQISLALDFSPTCANGRTLKYWDGHSQRSEGWDKLRRDPDLWISDGDCYIHLYERGNSRRGPSFRIRMTDLLEYGCTSLLDQYQSYSNSSSPQLSPHSHDFDISSDEAHTLGKEEHHIYIPAPAGFSREAALLHHVTTRNFLAWMYGVPVVGDRLGAALIALQERLLEYRVPECDHLQDLIAYLEDQEYTHFRNSPDHALAILQLAEHIRHQELWTDAFVHCVGMHDELTDCAENATVSRASQALITRARMEMHVRLEDAGLSLTSFLEKQVPGLGMQLNKDALSHLDRFRSFLQSHYVCQYGYWPPGDDSATDAEDFLPASVLQAMYIDFRSLYEYLADRHDHPQSRPVNGGDMVTENIAAFDRRNKYTALPHTRPLIPKVPERVNQRWYGKKKDKMEQRFGACSALVAATNSRDAHVMENGLVHDYLAFEKDCVIHTDGSISCVESRKVRWLLIYATLQVLVSVTRVPGEVRDSNGVDYPLCCQTAGTPPWTVEPLSRPAKDHGQQSSVSSYVGVPENNGSPTYGSRRETSASDNAKDNFSLDSPCATKHLGLCQFELEPDIDLVMPAPLSSHATFEAPSTLQQRRNSTILPQRCSLKSPLPVHARPIDFLRGSFSGSDIATSTQAGTGGMKTQLPSVQDTTEVAPPVDIGFVAPWLKSEPVSPMSAISSSHSNYFSPDTVCSDSLGVGATSSTMYSTISTTCTSDGADRSRSKTRKNFTAQLSRQLLQHTTSSTSTSTSTSQSAGARAAKGGWSPYTTPSPSTPSTPVSHPVHSATSPIGNSFDITSYPRQGYTSSETSPRMFNAVDSTTFLYNVPTRKPSHALQIQLETELRRISGVPLEEVVDHTNARAGTTASCPPYAVGHGECEAQPQRKKSHKLLHKWSSLSNSASTTSNKHKYDHMWLTDRTIRSRTTPPADFADEAAPAPSIPPPRSALRRIAHPELDAYLNSDTSQSFALLCQ